MVNDITGSVLLYAEHALAPSADIKIQFPCIIHFLQRLTQISQQVEYVASEYEAA